MLIYLIVPARYRNVILVAGSLIFYGVGEPFFVLLLIFSILINYGLSEYMWWEPKKPQKNRTKKAARRHKTSIIWNGVKCNIIDTPGHMDFIAEVERTFKMLDGSGMWVR